MTYVQYSPSRNEFIQTRSYSRHLYRLHIDTGPNRLFLHACAYV